MSFEVLEEPKTPVASENRRQPETPEQKVKAFVLSTPGRDFSFSPANTSISELVTTKQDLNEKLESSRLFLRQYQEREEELSKQIKDLTSRSKQAIGILEEKKYSLEDELESLRNEVDSMPDVEFLTEQLEILQGYDLKPKREFLELEPFIKMGILKQGDTIVALPKRIAEIQKEIDAYEGQTSSNMRLNSNQDDADIRRKISLMNTLINRSSEKAQHEMDALAHEVERLRDEYESLKEANRPVAADSIKRKKYTPDRLRPRSEAADNIFGSPRRSGLVSGSRALYSPN